MVCLRIFFMLNGSKNDTDGRSGAVSGKNTWTDQPEYGQHTKAESQINAILEKLVTIVDLNSLLQIGEDIGVMQRELNHAEIFGYRFDGDSG